MTKTIEFTHDDDTFPFEVYFDHDDIADYLVQRLKEQSSFKYHSYEYLEGAKKMAKLMFSDYDLDDLFDDDEDFDDFLRERFEDDFREALKDGAYDRE